MGRKRKELENTKHIPTDTIGGFDSLARKHGMTYGQLQVLENLRKVKIINNKLYRVVGDKVEPY